MVTEHPAELRAQVIAAVHAGETAYRVAKQFGLPETTVRSWVGKTRAPIDAVATADKRQQIQALYEEVLRTGLAAIVAIADQAANDTAWRQKQDASGLAILAGVLHDKCAHIAGAFAAEEASE